MKGGDDVIFSEILDKINSMSSEELLRKIKETPNSGVGYAIFGTKEEQQNNEESIVWKIYMTTLCLVIGGTPTKIQ